MSFTRCVHRGWCSLILLAVLALSDNNTRGFVIAVKRGRSEMDTSIFVFQFLSSSYNFWTSSFHLRRLFSLISLPLPPPLPASIPFVCATLFFTFRSSVLRLLFQKSSTFPSYLLLFSLAFVFSHFYRFSIQPLRRSHFHLSIFDSFYSVLFFMS